MAGDEPFHWTLSNPEDCEVSGSGLVSVSQATNIHHALSPHLYCFNIIGSESIRLFASYLKYNPLWKRYTDLSKTNFIIEDLSGC